jgi:hypothetical protein
VQKGKSKLHSEKCSRWPFPLVHACISCYRASPRLLFRPPDHHHRMAAAKLAPLRPAMVAPRGGARPHGRRQNVAMELPLRETEPSPRGILFGESQTLSSRLFAESKNNNSRWRKKLSVKVFFAKSKKNSRRRIPSPRVFFALGEVIFKKSFSHLQTFYHQHALIQRIYSNLTQFYLCLLYLKFLIHSR